MRKEAGREEFIGGKDDKCVIGKNRRSKGGKEIRIKRGDGQVGPFLGGKTRSSFFFLFLFPSFTSSFSLFFSRGACLSSGEEGLGSFPKKHFFLGREGKKSKDM